jgi:epoxyqueuosine reductase
MSELSVLPELRTHIRSLAQTYGFDDIRIARPSIPKAHQAYLEAWLGNGHHGDMHYLAEHRILKGFPEQLVPGTRSIVCVRKNYLPLLGDARQ